MDTTVQLIVTESMYTTVFYEIPSDISYRACTDISAICKAVFAVNIDMFRGQSVSGITICRGSGEQIV